MECGKYTVRLLATLVLGLFIHLMFNKFGSDCISKDTIKILEIAVTTISVLFLAIVLLEVTKVIPIVYRFSNDGYIYYRLCGYHLYWHVE